MTLKAVFSDPSDTYSALKQDWDKPPADGTSLAEFYAWEERRVDAMRQGRAHPFCYVWVPEASISLSRREAARLDVAGFSAEALAVRGTGGTAVPQGPGTANITLFTRHNFAPDITSYYGEMCAALQNGFRALGLTTTIGAKPGSFCDGAFNILLDDKKLAGTAQRWCRAKNGQTLGCHHVVVLTGGDPNTLCRRVENLYDYAKKPEQYDVELHSSESIEIRSLQSAMMKSLAGLVV